MPARNLAAIARLGHPDPIDLADRLAAAVTNDRDSQAVAHITLLSPVLGPPGLNHLRDALDALVVALPPVARNDYHAQAHRRAIDTARLEIADLTNDVDTYVSLQSEHKHIPAIAAKIADRLLKAGRATQALAALDAIAPDWPRLPLEWQLARAEALDALERRDEAQAFRLAWFHQTLNPVHLRAYLKRLPDFDDIEAEDAAIAFAQAYPDVHAALHFLLNWPALPAVAQLVLARHAEIDGNFYEGLTTAADKLEAKYPLAATLVLRAMIDFALDKARSARYPHAARHLAYCAELAARIDSFGAIEPHAAYLARLKSTHGRKFGFWSAFISQ